MIKFFKKIFSYLFFGLKSAENDMFSQKDGSESENNSISVIQESRNVYKDIKKGEVTQEVEELRHSTYNVYRESNNYQYLGDGVATKKEKKENGNEYHFTLHNNLVCDGVLDSFNKLETNDFGVDKYTLTIDGNTVDNTYVFTKSGVVTLVVTYVEDPSLVKELTLSAIFKM